MLIPIDNYTDARKRDKKNSLTPFASLLSNLYLPHSFASIAVRFPYRPLLCALDSEAGNGSAMGIDCCIDFAFPESAFWTTLTLHRRCLRCSMPKQKPKPTKFHVWPIDCIPRRAVARHGYFGVSY